MSVEELLKQAVAETSAKLLLFDVDDHVTVKIKNFKPRMLHALAMYRSGSQFRSGPIVWINARFVEMCEEQCAEPLSELTTTLLHEYGHVLYEFARIRFPALQADIDAIVEDEEDFAETFAVVVKKNAASPVYRGIVAKYMAALRSG